MGGLVVTLLDIGFNAARGCRGELGFAVLKRITYGNEIGTAPPNLPEPIRLAVNGVPVTTPVPVFALYKNGWEALSDADDAFLGAVSAGKDMTATVSILPETSYSGRRRAFRSPTMRKLVIS